MSSAQPRSKNGKVSPNLILLIVLVLIYLYKVYIPEDRKVGLNQTCINFINDSYRATFCLEHPAHTLALAIFYLATKYLSLVPATRSGPELSWLELLEKDIDIATLRGKQHV